MSVSGHLIVGQPLLDGQTGLVFWFDGFRGLGSSCELVIVSWSGWFGLLVSKWFGHLLTSQNFFSWLGWYGLQVSDEFGVLVN